MQVAFFIGHAFPLNQETVQSLRTRDIVRIGERTTRVLEQKSNPPADCFFQVLQLLKSVKPSGSFFLFLNIRGTFPAREPAPHALGSPIQAVIVVWAGKIANSFTFLAHHGVRTVLVRSLRLDGLASYTFFLCHAR
jgi:hypothetical protein